MSLTTRLFESNFIGNMELKNRIVMPGLGLAFAPDFRSNDRIKNFYIERAAGGVGLIVISLSRAEFLGHAVSLGINTDGFIAPLRELTSGIHSKGAKVAAQLTTRLSWKRREGDTPEFVGPSDVITSRHPGSVRPRPVTTEEIGLMVERLGEETLRSREAGFDAVEFLATGGTSLLSNFISPLTNKRTDQYGGCLENRYRFLLEVIAEARKKAGDDYPLLCRLSGSDFMEGGYGLEDTKKAAPILENAGIRALNVTTGWHDAPVVFFQQGVPQGAFIYLAEEVKKVVNIPVIGGTRITTPAVAERILAEGKVDLIFLGRTLIADPEWPRKALEGRPEDIRPCIACCHCFDLATAGEAVACTVNSRAGREGQYPTFAAATKRKTVFVIGGGPAGLEAARVASLRGHKVTVYDGQPELGGQLNVASVPPHKDVVRDLIEYFVTQLAKANVEIKLDHHQSPQSVLRERPDSVILATGATPLVPPIPGVDGLNVVTAVDVLAGRKDVGQKVTIIGGGLVGSETAEFLALKGREVMVLEMLDKIGADIGRSTRWVVLERLRNLGVKTEVKTRVEQVVSNGVKAKRNGAEAFYDCDSVVLATGARSNLDMEEFLAEFKKNGIEVQAVGDRVKPRRIVQAIDEGFRAGMAL